MFIPYRARIKLTRFPWMTVSVSALCLLVFLAQERNMERVVESAKTYCTGTVAAEVERLQRLAFRGDSGARLPCWEVMAHTYMISDQDGHVRMHQQALRKNGDEDDAGSFAALFTGFAAQAPSFLTGRLVQVLGNWNPLNMLSSTFAHGSWDHVIGNLFFFVAFALVVETVIGPVLFGMVFLIMVFGIGAVDNLAAVADEGTPTLGLSGVVMGMMALAAWFAPRVQINYFYWFFYLVGILRVPLWFVASWYIGWNVFDQLSQEATGINYVAHLAGAAIGLGLGVTLFRQKRHWARDHLLPDEPDPHEDPSWLRQLNALGNLPLAMLAGFFTFFMVVLLLSKFLVAFAVQLLLIAPAVAAGVQLYRMKREDRPDWTRYRQAQAWLKEHRYAEALKLLAPLAEKGYPRAQYDLARLCAQGLGMPRDPAGALRWLTRAAERDHAPAQYALGARYADGDGVPRDPEQALKWYEKAMYAGLPEAAMSLGHLYENHPDKDARNPAKAAQAYRIASDLYRRKGLEEDAQMAERCRAACAPL